MDNGIIVKKQPICPRCGRDGQIIKPITLQSHLKHCENIADNDVYAICKTSFCEVVYFGPKVFLKDDVNVRVWYKESDQTVPVCYCRGISTADIFNHIVNNQCCSTWDEIKIHMGVDQDQACLTNNPAGQ
ncbi:MAG: (2Fe-2S)-binding protein [Acidobacteriota bacterium]